MTDASSLVMTGAVAYALVSHGVTRPGSAPQPAAIARDVTLTLVAPAATTVPPAAPRATASAVTPLPVKQPMVQAPGAHHAATHPSPLHHASALRTHPATIDSRSAEVAQTAHPPAAMAHTDIVAARAALAGREAVYTALIHTLIEHNKSNPDSAAYRMLHPHGTAVVGFSLSRAGASDVPHVIASSGSEMLDHQAEHIVVTCHFPPMPDGIFPSEDSHGFTVAITFPPFGAAD